MEISFGETHIGDKGGKTWVGSIYDEEDREYMVMMLIF